ncbi:MAG TPA: hypothetical protein DIC22_04855 [Chitinophagaceae bacterium]|nr:hypothetical protein [Chitinophagaceae bacterium]
MMAFSMQKTILCLKLKPSSLKSGPPYFPRFYIYWILFFVPSSKNNLYQKLIYIKKNPLNSLKI